MPNMVTDVRYYGRGYGGRYYGRGYGYGGYGYGGAAAAGIIGGLAAGAIIGSAAANNGYYYGSGSGTMVRALMLTSPRQSMCGRAIAAATMRRCSMLALLLI